MNGKIPQETEQKDSKFKMLFWIFQFWIFPRSQNKSPNVKKKNSWHSLHFFIHVLLLWFYYLLKRNVHMFKIVVACIYSGYRFAKIYSGTQSLGNIEFSTNINYYEDQAWTWMFFLIVGAVVLLIGKRHAFKRYEKFALNTSC